MYQELKYTTREEALAHAIADRLIAVHIVTVQRSNRTEIAFRHIGDDGALRDGPTDGYNEEYYRDEGGNWLYSHRGLGAGCFWTDDEPTSGNPYSGDPVGTTYGVRLERG